MLVKTQEVKHKEYIVVTSDEQHSEAMVFDKVDNFLEHSRPKIVEECSALFVETPPD